MNTLPIETVLQEAWDFHENNNERAAFEKLHSAVCLLFQECKDLDAAQYRTANIASCLANGIQPD